MGGMRRRLIAAQPHLVTASGETLSVAVAEPKVQRLAVTFTPVQSGSGTPSPSNVRPISGFSEIPVYLTVSANLFDKAAVTQGYYIKSNGDLAGDNTWCISPYIPVSGLASISYLGLTTVGNAPQSAWYDASKNFISSFKQATGSNTISVPSGAAYARFSVFFRASSDPDTFMVVSGSQIGTYEPYRGITPTANLGGTYYDGTVDLVSGVMTVTKHGFTGTQSGLDIRFDHAETTIVVGLIVMNTSGLPGYGGEMISSRFSTSIASGNAGRMVISGAGLFFVMPRSDFSGTPDDAAVKQWFVDHPTTFVYTLATPQTVTLTPQTIAALRGQQTVTSPAGSVEISYWTH